MGEPWERAFVRKHAPRLNLTLALAFALTLTRTPHLPQRQPLPTLNRHAPRLNFVACGADAKDTLWPGHFHRYRGRPAPDFEERWQNHTELSLRVASPGVAGGGSAGDTVGDLACGPVAEAAAVAS